MAKATTKRKTETPAAEAAAPVTAPPAQRDITHIPLGRLQQDPDNVRRSGAEENIGELVSSIAAHGLIMPLAVKAAGQGIYRVIAGGRRLLALASLNERGAIPADYAVPCVIFPGDMTDEAILEISLAENVVRLPMHPADQYAAFAALAEKKMSSADIAARFGVTAKAVEQLLRLARVSPLVLEAYRTGALDLEQVQAFAVTDDRRRQEKLFKSRGDWSDSWRSSPSHIRAALTESEITAEDRRVKYVTLKAYEAAGGTVRRDLFCTDEDGIFIEDAALLDRLCNEKLEKKLEAVRAEGWSWAELRESFGYSDRSKFSQHGKEGRNWEPAVLAAGGAVLCLNNYGDLNIERGLVRKADEKTLDAARKAVSKGKEPVRAGDPAAKKKAAPRTIEHSQGLTELLTARLTAAIGIELANNPHVALAAVVDALAGRTLYGETGYGRQAGCLQLTASGPAMPEELKGKDGCPAYAALTAKRKEWKDALPARGQLFAWLLGQTDATLLQLLAVIAGASADLISRSPDSRPDKDEIALAQALQLDMTKWFTPTAANYFGRISRAENLLAIRQMTGKPATPAQEKLKKDGTALEAERSVRKTGWLPEPLRIPAPSKTGKPKPAAKKKGRK